MFDYLECVLQSKSPAKVVVDVNGVGYELTVPLSTYQKLPDCGKRVKILAYLHTTEVSQQLLGFSHEDERVLFKMLLSVSGIGPKTALTILSGIGGGEFKRAVIQGDIEVLKSISGIGRKTAERLVVELREKLVVEGDVAAKRKHMQFPAWEAVERDSVAALITLGYKRSEAVEAIRKVFERQGGGGKSEPLPAEQIIRESLRLL